jgi:mannose-6-phosphate isomerase-like protein (cupin superfamily)
MQKISISEKLRTFDKYWQTKEVGEFNGQSLKLAKLKGEFEWHRHQAEDELYLVLKGQLNLEMKNEAVVLEEGELFIVPKNNNHRLSAAQEVHLLMLEPKSTLNMEGEKGQRDADS